MRYYICKTKNGVLSSPIDFFMTADAAYKMRGHREVVVTAAEYHDLTGSFAREDYNISKQAEKF